MKCGSHLAGFFSKNVKIYFTVEKPQLFFSENGKVYVSNEPASCNRGLIIRDTSRFKTVRHLHSKVDDFTKED